MNFFPAKDDVRSDREPMDDVSSSERSPTTASGDGVGAGLGQLCEQIAPAVYGWAVLRIPASLRLRIEPEDVVQEVFCRILAKPDGFDSARGSFRAWVFGIARHVLHEALRNCARKTAGGEHLGFTELALLPEQATTLTRRVARAEIMRRFAERVDGLEHEERKLLLLRGLEGLEHDDVARELKISSHACAKRWQRLRERLGGEFELLVTP